MKLTKRTIEILKNFSYMNPSIVFEKGSRIATVSSGRSVMAYADIEEEFKTSFAVYDLKKFLATINLFQEPILEFEDTFVRISGDGRRVLYRYADISLCQVKSGSTVFNPYEKCEKIKFPDAYFSFELSSTDYSDLRSAASVLRLNDIVIEGNGEKVDIKVNDVANPTTDEYSIHVGEDSKEFRYVIKNENLRLIESPVYKVECVNMTESKKVAVFKGSDTTYFVSVEANGSFSK